LSAKLDAPVLAQLTQRVRLRFHLTALSLAESRGYIQPRLEVAGAGDREIFAEETFPEIFRYTGGVPRLINTLCDTAMMAAYTADRGEVSLEDIESAVEELQWVEFSARTQQPIHAAAELAPRRVRAREPALPPLARLLVATEGRTVQEIPLAPGRIIIGRTPENDLQIDSRFISRHHCQITTTANSCVIEDLNSTNGISVKSRRVRRHYLNDGDVVQVGKHELIYVDERITHMRDKLTDTSPGVPTLHDAGSLELGEPADPLPEDDFEGEPEAGLEARRDQS
jgi:pSer/pThr/pTyr-binding forkhead associated (FHA) protein